MYYCGKECQKKDWLKVHKQECKYLAGEEAKKMKEIISNDRLWKSTIRVLRFVFMCKYEPGLLDKQFVLFDGRTRKIDDLMHHVDLLPPCLGHLRYIGFHFTQI